MALQRAEAIADTVLAQLQAAGVYALTIHGSVLCQTCDASLVRDLLTNAFQEAYALKPKLDDK